MVNLLLAFSIDLLFDLKEDSVTLSVALTLRGNFTCFKENLSQLVSKDSEVFNNLDLFVKSDRLGAVVDNGLQESFTVALEEEDFNLGPGFRAFLFNVRG